MTQFSRKPVENAAPRRGRPPTRHPLEVAVAASPDDALSRLEARAAAPMQALAEAGEALRVSMATYAARARACDDRLAQLEAVASPLLATVRKLPIEEFGMILGEGRGLIPGVRAKVALLSILFQPKAEPDLVIPSVRQVLSRIPARISRLKPEPGHVCAAAPPGCGCPAAVIKRDVENAERAAVAGVTDLAALRELLVSLDAGLTARGPVVVTSLSKPPASASVSVVHKTGDPEGDFSDE